MAFVDGRAIGHIVSDTLGWMYTIAWSISFYPQIIMNFRRKSVQGLSIDFLYLNVFGFLCYSVFNIGLFASAVLRDEYRQRHDGNNPQVRGNDVVFAVHALATSSFTVLQSLFYKRDPRQGLSSLNRVVLSTFVLASIIGALLSFGGKVNSLDYVYFLSYLKLYISIAKYIPQAWLNYRRKSTVGWSIHNILLDFTGGVLSVVQLILDSALANDWSAILGAPVKFGLGILSISFDILFMTQHYILYRHSQSGLLKDHVEAAIKSDEEAEGERQGLLENQVDQE